MHDFRFAFRSLAKSPGYTLAVVLTLALGIGAATAIFSVADRILFRPPPYPFHERLVVLGQHTKRLGFLNMAYPVEIAAYRRSVPAIEAYASMAPSFANLVVDGVPIGVRQGSVSLDYFTTLGAIPALGRSFLPDEDQPGNDAVVILSDHLWRERFTADPAVLGKSVIVNGTSCRVIGVTPKRFEPPALSGGSDIYRPQTNVFDPARPIQGYAIVIARLRAGATCAQANAEIAAAELPIAPKWVRSFKDQRREVKPYLERVTRMKKTGPYWALLAAVACLYGIACVNAVNLMLARLQSRRRELVVRLALGGSHWQIARLLVAENLLLTALASATGVVLAQWLFPILIRIVGDGSSGIGRASVDWRVLGFMGVLSVGTALLVSVLPTLRLRQTNVTEGLSEGSHTFGENRRLRAVRSLLVVVEAALAVVLLVGAGLMARTVQRLDRLDRGFDLTNKAAVWLQIPRDAYKSADARRVFYEQLESRVRAVPGVSAITVSTTVPLAGTSSGYVKRPDGTEIRVGGTATTPSFNRMLGMSLVKGRWFDDAVVGGAPVVVLNETLARAYFGDEEPLGRTFECPWASGPKSWQVVGIVRDLHVHARGKPEPEFWHPYWQDSDDTVCTLLIRTSGRPDAALADGIRRAVFSINPLIATMPLRLLSESADQQIASERYTKTVLQVLSTIALGLAVAGLFAIMAYGVSERMGEFGVRMALGAMPQQLFRLVLSRGLILAALGVVIGGAAAWGLTRFLQSLLYETSATDPLVYGGVAALLLVAAALGCWLPARRAMRADVVKLLRRE
ncbi:ADOP family duplicated permease [Opitutus sp. ER46]|uniref:ADOP family duplicated permease n=1 Tax=Opitutus sp. ER46 TaxID=2161864 RepID=UPI000D2F8249|nr:ADOP family duplicated permease [Opitutus sp. ER46]PTX94392.1 hypothetical protein DB354_11610 [Opitutus sp. ER46]